MNTTQNGFQMINIVGPLLIALFAAILVLVLRARRKSTIVVDRERVLGAQAEWRAPDGLANASLPRGVKLTGTSWGVMGLMVVLVAGAGVMGSMAARAADEAQQKTELLQREGMVVQGTIVRKWKTGGRSPTRKVEYSFTVAGVRQSATAQVTTQFYTRVDAGSPARITYARSNPGISQIEFGVAPLPWLPFVFAVPLVALLFVPYGMWRQKQLLEYGSPAAAVVERVSPIKGGYVVTYQFIGANGDTVKGKCSVTNSSKPVAGDVITVVYDPERPARSSRYPLKYVKLADV